MKRRILYIDTAYTVEAIRARELEQFWLSRECGGYFDHVWTIHPLADRPRRRTPANDGFRLERTEMSERLTALEGESTYYAWLAGRPSVNVLASQARLIAHLAAFVRRERISLVCVTDPHFAGMVGLAVKALTGVPVVVWVIQNYDDTWAATGALAMPSLLPRRWMQKLVERVVFRLVDLTAGGNQNNLEFALNNGASPERSTVFPVGKNVNRIHIVDPSLRAHDEWFAGREGKRHFICIGRLTDVKLPADAVRAFAVAASFDPNVRLIMAGDGPMRAELEQLAADLGVAERVHFLGYINQGRLAALLAGCFAVLSPLTGGALIEAALGGLPLVAYDRDWQDAFVRPAGAGIIVPFRDWKKMGEAAITLLQDPSLAARMGQAARTAGLRACDLDAAFAREQAAFERILAPAGRRGTRR